MALQTDHISDVQETLDATCAKYTEGDIKLPSVSLVSAHYLNVIGSKLD